MLNVLHKSLRDPGGHSTRLDLLRFLDGELSQGRAKKVRVHLEQCWSCRLLRQEIEQGISRFMEERAARLAEGHPLPPQGWRNFDRRLQQLAEQTVQPSWLSRFKESIHRLNRPRLAFRFASLATALLVFMWMISSSNQVSAKEVLEKAGQAEAMRFGYSADSVAYRKLRVASPAARRTDGILEIWTDLESGATGYRGGDGTALEFLALLDRGRIKGFTPLSAADFQDWRSSLRAESEEVIESETPDGVEVLTIKTETKLAAAEAGIIGVELALRKSDWRPVRQVLKIQVAGVMREYHLVEEEFTLMARSSLAPDIFGEEPSAIDSPPVARVKRPHQHVPEEAPPSVQEEPQTAALSDLDKLEVEAHYALHRAGLSLVGTVELQRREGQGIVLHGVVESLSQKQGLLENLPVSNALRVEIETVEEIRKGRANGPQAAGKPEKVIEVRGRTLPIQERLTQSGQRDTTTADARHLFDLSNEAVSLSRSALQHAWALGRIADAYPPARLKGLSLSSRWLLEVMLRDHVDALEEEVVRSSSILAPVLVEYVGTQADGTAGAGTSAVLPPGLEWQTTGLQVRRTTERFDELIRTLFAGANLSVETSEEAAREVLATMPRLRESLASLREQILAAFSQSETRGVPSEGPP